MASTGSASYNFNSFQEIKSHSSILYNERMAILFYLLDMKNLAMHQTRAVNNIYEVHAVLRQIYKNIRMLLRFNPTVRTTLHLDTKDDGIYVIDIAMAMIDKMLKYCENSEFTEKRIYILMQELDNAEMVIKDILQYFSYFIRPDFKQKPDVEVATEKYKEIADKKTVDELREIVGKNHKIDFGALGGERITLDISNPEEIEYDPILDGNLSEYSKDVPEEIELEDERENIDFYDEEDENAF